MDAAGATRIYGQAGVFGAVGGGLLGPVMLVLLPVPISAGGSDQVRAVVFLSPWAVAAGVVVVASTGWCSPIAR